jgi:hypothetical protein
MRDRLSQTTRNKKQFTAIHGAANFEQHYIWWLNGPQAGVLMELIRENRA